MSAGTSPLLDGIGQVWDTEIVPALFDYIRIPCLSANFDPDWRAHGHMDRAVELVAGWCRERAIAGLSVDVVSIPGRSPLILVEVPAFGEAGAARGDDVVLMYGHIDKQPEMTGWREDLGPWTPVLEGTKLYGRGCADDGYAAFASLLAIEAAQAAGWSHTRIVVLVEASEESGSPDLPAYLEALRDRLGSPSLVLCLDSECLDDEHLWATTSLRGLVSGVLRVDILTQGVHSGSTSGVVPSSFRIVRQLLDRLEDPLTGETRLPELVVEVPEDRIAAAHETGRTFRLADHFPFVAGAHPTTDDPGEQLLRRTWHTSLSITGVDGIPPLAMAGNVLRPTTAVTVSIRIPPTCDHRAALAAVERVLTADPPYGARVSFTDAHAGPGWNAPPFAPWLDEALREASLATYGDGYLTFGEGGSIPFMGMLGEMFPEAQFVITGVLLPDSGAHGPNEYLDVEGGKKITAALAHLLRSHAVR